MKVSSSYNATILRITGNNNSELYYLANLYSEPIDSNEISSIISDLKMENNSEMKGHTIFSKEKWLTAMDQSENGYLFAVSMDGELYTDKSGNWEISDLQCPDGLNDIYAASDDKIFCVGVSGERVFLDGGSLDIIRDKSNRRLNAIHGISAQNVFAAGDVTNGAFKQISTAVGDGASACYSVFKELSGENL